MQDEGEGRHRQYQTRRGKREQDQPPSCQDRRDNGPTPDSPRARGSGDREASLKKTHLAGRPYITAKALAQPSPTQPFERSSSGGARLLIIWWALVNVSWLEARSSRSICSYYACRSNPRADSQLTGEVLLFCKFFLSGQGVDTPSPEGRSRVSEI